MNRPKGKLQGVNSVSGAGTRYAPCYYSSYPNTSYPNMGSLSMRDKISKEITGKLVDYLNGCYKTGYNSMYIQKVVEEVLRKNGI